MSYIEVKDASVIYNEGSDNQVDALTDVNLKIEKDEFVIFFGPSGCGKTTLLNLISGLEKPTRGQVCVDGEDISTFDANRMALFHCNKIGMVFQAYNLIQSLSVLDNVVLPRIFLGDSDKEARKQRARELLERFGVDKQADKFPVELSGGQQQRIGIARSLINDQPLILADEPVGNLDSKSAEVVLGMLEELNEKEGKTIIMVTHNAEHLKFADHIFHMKDGRVVNETVSSNKKKKVDLKDLKPEERELELLSRSFAGLSDAQMNVLVAPFKAKVLVGYLSHALDFNQNERLEALMTKRLSEELTSEKFALMLDVPMEKGGVGLNSVTAKNYFYMVETLLGNVRMLQADLSPLAGKLKLPQEELKAKLVVRYFVKEYLPDVTTEQLKIFEAIVLKRLGNELGREEMAELLDIPVKEGGMGLDVRVVRKIAREMELMLLIRFSQVQKSGNALPADIVRSHTRKMNLIAEDLKHIEDLVNSQL